jgi:hypothetical protein
MKLNVKKVWPTAAISIAAFTAMLNAEGAKYKDRAMRCDRTSLCGPDVGVAVTPAARPFTNDACCCDSGEFFVTVAGFYWQATEDGLEYAIESKVTTPTDATATGSAANLVDASYQTPDFKWKPGFKVGIGYNTTHDGWDFNLLWTHYNGRANSSNDNESELNVTYLPLWSAFAPAAGGDAAGTILWANQGDTSWRLALNLVDLELGREFWVSKMLTVRPHVGVRVALIRQRYEIENIGGIYTELAVGKNETVLKTSYNGAGVRGGLDTLWNFGCCDPCSGNWGIFGNIAWSLIYGKYDIDHDEYNQSPDAATGFAKAPVMSTDNNFRAVRGIMDLALGLQWQSLFNDSNYGILLQLAWEFHQFFNQNQFWRINRVMDSTTAAHGENVFAPSRGDLSTQGVTLTVRLTF